VASGQSEAAPWYPAWHAGRRGAEVQHRGLLLDLAIVLLVAGAATVLCHDRAYGTFEA
jgi:hypothetical protein